MREGPVRACVVTPCVIIIFNVCPGAQTQPAAFAELQNVEHPGGPLNISARLCRHPRVVLSFCCSEMMAPSSSSLVPPPPDCFAPPHPPFPPPPPPSPLPEYPRSRAKSPLSWNRSSGCLRVAFTSSSQAWPRTTWAGMGRPLRTSEGGRVGGWRARLWCWLTQGEQHRVPGGVCGATDFQVWPQAVRLAHSRSTSCGAGTTHLPEGGGAEGRRGASGIRPPSTATGSERILLSLPKQQQEGERRILAAAAAAGSGRPRR